MTSLQKDVTNSLRIDDVDKPMDPQVASGEPVPASDAAATSTDLAMPTTPAAPAPETSVEAETHAAAAEPLAIMPQIHSEPAAAETSDLARDAKAS
jgi:sec-independent protein translocase protein TatB